MTSIVGYPVYQDPNNPIPYAPNSGYVEVGADVSAIEAFKADVNAQLAQEGTLIFDPLKGFVPLEDITRSSANSVASTASERQTMASGVGQTHRLIYGTQRVGAQILYWKAHDAHIYVVAEWSLGEINQVVKVLFDGIENPSWIEETYTGTITQTRSPLIYSIDATYDDNLVLSKGGASIGVAYQVLRIPADQFPSNIEGIIEGKKVWNGTSMAYSTNPSYCLADFAGSDIYGPGWTVDSTSLTTSAAANDEDPTGSSGTKRREVNLAIDKPAKPGVYIELLRGYAGCMIVPCGDEIKLSPNRPASVVESFAASDILVGSMKIKKAGIINKPTVMKVIYTDTNAEPWVDAEAIVKYDDGSGNSVDEGTVPYRESVIRLPGITTYAQAYREALERLNKFTNDLSCSFIAFDKALKIARGDVIEVSHPSGLTSKKLRVLDSYLVEPGRWSIAGREYDPANYSDTIQTEPTYPDTTLPSPASPLPPTITGLTEAVEEQDDGSFISRIDVTFTEPDFPWVKHYLVMYDTAGINAVTMIVPKGETSFSTPPLMKQGTYTVVMFTVSSTGVYSSVDSDSVVVDGETGTPTDPGSITKTERGSTIGIKIPRWPDDSIASMKVKRGSTTSTWDTATDVTVTTSNEFIDLNVPTGDYKYLVKTLRTDGTESTNSSSVTASVGNDTDFDFIAAQLGGSSASFGGNFDGALDSATGDIDGATTIDGGTTLGALAAGTGTQTYYAATEPGGANSGDLWIDSDDNKLYRYSGSEWVDVQDDDIGAAQATADGKIVTFAQDSEPTGQVVGDLWVDTNAGNKLYRWNGSSWIDMRDTTISDAQATADGKIVTFYQDASPTAEGIGDLWVDTNDKNKLYRWSGSAWVTVRDTDIEQALTNAANAQTTANDKSEVFYATTAPSGSSGDLWVDSNDGNKLYRHNGSTWIDIQDTDISAAQSTADGKIVTFAQAAQPTADGTGDLWVDTDDGNKLYRWNGSSWVDTQDTAIIDAQATADGKVTTFYSNTQPTPEGVGDLWVETDNNNKLWRYSGSTWQSAQDGTISIAQATADGKIVTYAQDAIPTTGAYGDLWIDTNNKNKVYRCFHATLCNSINSGEWEEVRDTDIAQAIDDAADAQTTADGKIVTFYSAAQPVGASEGDLWVETDNDNKLWRYSGSAWQSVRDGTIQDAQQAADDAQTDADTANNVLDSGALLAAKLENSAVSITANNSSWLTLSGTGGNVVIGDGGIVGSSGDSSELHDSANDVNGQVLLSNSCGLTGINNYTTTSWIDVSSINTLRIVKSSDSGYGRWHYNNTDADPNTTCTASTLGGNIGSGAYDNTLDVSSYDWIRMTYDNSYPANVTTFSLKDNAGQTVFSLDTSTGDAIFKGDITGASGTFAGSVTSTTQMSVTEGTYNTPSAIFTNSYSGRTKFGVGVKGVGYDGVYGVSNSASGAGVYGEVDNSKSAVSCFAGDVAPSATGLSQYGIKCTANSASGSNASTYAAHFTASNGAQALHVSGGDITLNADTTIGASKNLLAASSNCDIGTSSDYFGSSYVQYPYHDRLYSNGSEQTTYNENTGNGSGAFQTDGVVELMELDGTSGQSSKKTYFYKFYEQDLSSYE